MFLPFPAKAGANREGRRNEAQRLFIVGGATFDRATPVASSPLDDVRVLEQMDFVMHGGVVALAK